MNNIENNIDTQVNNIDYRLDLLLNKELPSTQEERLAWLCKNSDKETTKNQCTKLNSIFILALWTKFTNEFSKLENPVWTC